MGLADRLARLRSEAAPSGAGTPPAASPVALPGAGEALAEVAPAEDAHPEWYRERERPAEPVVVERPRPRGRTAPGVCGRCGGPSGPGHIFRCPRSPLVEVPVVVRPLDQMPPLFRDMSPAERRALGMRVETPTQIAWSHR